MPQLKEAVEELQGKGYGIPDYPDDPADDEQREVRGRYDNGAKLVTFDVSIT